MKTAQEWHDELLALMNRPPSFSFCQASVADIEGIQADAQTDLRAELTRWQNAFAMFRGSPEELASWAVKTQNKTKGQMTIWHFKD